MIRDKDTKRGIANAIVKIEDLDHDIRSGIHIKCFHLFYYQTMCVIEASLDMSRNMMCSCSLKLPMVITGAC